MEGNKDMKRLLHFGLLHQEEHTGLQDRIDGLT